jgi:hypothetical protein
MCRFPFKLQESGSGLQPSNLLLFRLLFLYSVGKRNFLFFRVESRNQTDELIPGDALYHILKLKHLILLT